MLTYLYECSRGRSAWFLLMISALALDGIALFFQHGMGLQPCVMCIYERIAVLGIAFAGFLGWIAPRSAIYPLAGYCPVDLQRDCRITAVMGTHHDPALPVSVQYL